MKGVNRLLLAEREELLVKESTCVVLVVKYFYFFNYFLFSSEIREIPWKCLVKTRLCVPYFAL